MSNCGFTIPTNDYDNEGRLVSFNGTSGLNQTWSLSAVGDWNSFTISSVNSQPVTESSTNEQTYSSSSSSRLQSPASSLPRVYASYIDEPVLRWQTSSSTALYYHRNQQYSVYAVTNSSGAVQERYAYTAYGVPTICNAAGLPLTPQSSTLSNRYMYTGREWDSVIHQYHYRARMYDPSLGRFCSRDPIGYRGGINFYRYVDSNPFTWVDPTGRHTWKDCEDWDKVCRAAANIKFNACVKVKNDFVCWMEWGAAIAECVAEGIACIATADETVAIVVIGCVTYAVILVATANPCGAVTIAVVMIAIATSESCTHGGEPEPDPHPRVWPENDPGNGGGGGSGGGVDDPLVDNDTSPSDHPLMRN